MAVENLVLDRLAIIGNVRVYSRRPSFLAVPEQNLAWPFGDWKLECRADNLVVTAGKILVAKMLMDESGFDTGLTRIEVGTGTTSPALGDIALVTATVRKTIISSPIRTGNVVEYRAFFPAADITANLRETGIFGHSTAGAGLGSGELFARALITFNNATSPADATIVWTLTFG